MMGGRPTRDHRVRPLWDVMSADTDEMARGDQQFVFAFSDGIRDCSECSWAVLWNREELACRPRFLSAKDRFLIFIHSVGKVYQPLVIFF